MDQQDKRQWEKTWIGTNPTEAWKLSSSRLLDNEGEINKATTRLSEIEDKIEELLKSILEAEMTSVPADELQAKLDLEVKNLRKRKESGKVKFDKTPFRSA
ncbi:hypothetical protein RvY_09386 [Ramazzottius varieornatus]|uniref:Uncharacterized protein n=1 Tax=Ramazzottius varieornatus TaxID=947166 RepID=A0A1D1V958_RAMVA|nr:hypothetical protein RvY_09386 [Ramazzottius varieornatus]